MTERIFPNLGSRYVIVDQLDEGGMATIYRGRDTQLDQREVAIKLLKYTSANDEAQIRNEVQIMLRLEHPHIVTVLDAGKSLEGQPFIVMELLRGKNLAAYLAEHPDGRLPVVQGLDFARQLCQALAYAHGLSVYHGDISSRNIFVCANGKLKLLDFGTSRVREATMTVTPESRRQGIAVTLAYAAPEIFDNTQRLSDRLRDVYAYGVVLYEMFTGQRPFQGHPERVLIARIMHTSPAPPRLHAPNLPRTLQRLILVALARKPSERHQSFSAIQADLERIREGLTRLEIGLLLSAVVGLLVVGFIAGRVNASDGEGSARIAEPGATAPPIEPGSSAPEPGPVAPKPGPVTPKPGPVTPKPEPITPGPMPGHTESTPEPVRSPTGTGPNGGKKDRKPDPRTDEIAKRKNIALGTNCVLVLPQGEARFKVSLTISPNGECASLEIGDPQGQLKANHRQCIQNALCREPYPKSSKATQHTPTIIVKQG